MNNGLRADVEIEGLTDLIADVQAAGANAEPLVTAALVNSTNKAQQEIRTRTPHATGTLQRSVLPEVDYPVGLVAVNEDYGIFVEEGTPPHMPPSAPVAQWIKKKGLPGDALWPILKTIEKRGTKAQPFFKPGWEAAEPYVLSQFDTVTSRLLTVLAGR